MTIGLIDTEYDKFKTPYFRIKIGTASGANMVELPPSLLSLVEKVEITETMAKCKISSQFNIVFKEGSREPFDKGLGTSTKALYSDADITNATGMLTDLRFSELSSGSTGGFTSVIPNLVGAAQDLMNTSAALSNSAQTTAIVSGGELPTEDKKIIADDTAKLKNVTYVFQQNNLVEITWGYLGGSEPPRTIRGNIIVVQSDFPEQGHSQTTISCAGPGSWLDQLAPLDAIYFREEAFAGFDPSAAAPLISFEDMDMKATLKKLFPGFKIIVSDNLLAEKKDKYHTKVIPAGQSPEQFLRKLQKSNNAMYISYYSHKDNKPVIAYISRNDFMKRELFSNKNLFTYKAPGSILKSVSVKADFNGLSGAGMGGVASDGTIVKAATNNGNVAETLFEGKSIIDTSPANGNKIPQAEQINSNLFGNGKLTVSKVELTPEADDPTKIEEATQATAACRGRTIFLEFTAQGYTKATTGVIYFGGIGNRYSGQYEVITVTHVIDSNGYNIRGTAQSAMVDGESGVKPKDAQQGESIPQAEVKMFQSASTFKTFNPSDIGSSLGGGGGSAMDAYLEDIYA